MVLQKVMSPLSLVFFMLLFKLGRPQPFSTKRPQTFSTTKLSTKGKKIPIIQNVLELGLFKKLEKIFLAVVDPGKLCIDTVYGCLSYLCPSYSANCPFTCGLCTGTIVTQSLIRQNIGNDTAYFEGLTLRSINIVTIYTDTFINMNQLSILDFGENIITTLNDTVFSPLTSLQVAILNSNKLIRMSPVQFNGLINLYEIDLGTNNLTVLPNTLFTNLTKLNRLFLKNNKLTTLSIDIFQSLKSLTFLDLSFNMFSSLPDGLFKPTHSLTRLDMSDNRFTDISTGLFALLGNLEDLDLSNNK